MAQGDLVQVLDGLPKHFDPNVLVGIETSDDAGVYRLSDDLALIHTVDFFTPVVDDPHDFGAVAAANALSDVYAMGGEPFVALNLVGFPVGELDLGILREILRGSGEKCVEAGVAVIGGHSIDDKEPKFGLAVTGRVHPAELWTNRGAQAGDLLILTKPLGIGILTTGLKRDRLTEPEIHEVVALMATLNRGAARVGREVGGIHAATDITGYGLLGHLYEVASASGLEAQVWLDRVPLISPRVHELAEEGMVPGGTRRNLAFVNTRTRFDTAVGEIERLILADAQTSGGLLFAVDAEHALALQEALVGAGTPAAAVVGKLGPGTPGQLRVLPGRP